MARKSKQSVRESKERAQPTKLVRALDVTPASVSIENRTFDFVLATETPVRICGELPKLGFCTFSEILVADGLDPERLKGMPLADSHDLSTVDNILGRVIEVKREGESWIGTARVSRVGRGERILADVADGILNQVSVGYTVDPSDYDVDVTDADADAIVARAKRWVPHEISLVAVGADPNAVVRSAAPPSNKRNRSMDLTALEAAADAAVAAAEAVATAADAAPDNTVLADAATTALDAADAAVTAVDAAIEAAGDDKDEQAIERSKSRADRAKGLRDARTKARAEGGADAGDAAEAGAEQGADAGADDAAKEDEKAVRSMAKKSGLAKLSDQLFTAGFKPAEVRSALMTALIQRSEAVGEIVTRPATAPAANDGKRALSTADIYANLNKRSA